MIQVRKFHTKQPLGCNALHPLFLTQMIETVSDKIQSSESKREKQLLGFSVVRLLNLLVPLCNLCLLLHSNRKASERRSEQQNP